MKRSTSLSLIALTFALLGTPTAWADIVTTAGSGNWNSTTPNAPWPGGTVPATGDDVIITSNHSITVTESAAINSITFNNNTTGTKSLTVNADATLTVADAILMQNAANASLTATITGAGTITATSLTVGGSTTPITTAGRTTTLTCSIGALNLSGNLTLTGQDVGTPDNDAILNFVSGTISVGGTVVWTQSGQCTVTLNMNTGAETGTLDLSGATPFSGTGTLTFDPAGANATVIYSGAAQTVLTDTYQNLTLSGSDSKTTTGITVNGTLSLQGTATVGNTFTYGASAILEYKGSAAQTVSANEFPAAMSADVIIDNAAGVTLTAAKTLTANLTLTSGEFATGGNLTMGTTGTPVINVSGGSMTGILAGANDYNVSYTGNSKTTGTELSGSGLNNVAVNLTSDQTLTLGSAMSAAGTLTVQSGTFDANGSAATVTGLTTVSGGNYLASTATQTLTGGLVLTGGTFTGSSGAVTVGNVTLTSGVLDAPNASGSFDVAGNITGAGATFNPGTGKVVFTGTGTQTSTLTTYNDLEVNGTGNTLQPQNDITINGNLTISSGTFDQAAATRTVAKGGSGTITVGASGKITLRRTGTTPYSSTFTGGWGAPTLQSGSTVEYLSATASLELTSFHHLIVNNSGDTFSLSGNTAVSGNVTVLAGTLTTTATPYSLDVSGNITLTGILTANGSTINIGGDLAGAGTLNADTSTVVFNGAGAQSIDASGLGGTFNHLTIDKSGGAATLAGAIVVNGDLTITTGTLATANFGVTLNGNFVNSGTLTAGSSVITIGGMGTQSIDGFTTTGTVTMTKTAGTATFQGNVNGAGLTPNGAGGTLNLGTGLTHTFTGVLTRTAGAINGGSSTLNIAGNITGTGGTFTPDTGKVVFNGTGTQTSTLTTYNDLEVNGTGNTLQPQNNITINGNLTISSGTFDQAAATRTIARGGSGAITVGDSGKIALRRTGPTPYSSTFTGGWGAPTLQSGSTVEYLSATASLELTSFHHLVVNNTAEVFSLSGPTLVSGNLTVSGGTLNTTGANDYSLEVAGDLAVGTQTLTANGSTITIGGNFTGTGTFNPGTSTIIFNGSGAQSVPVSSGFGNFYNLTLNKSGGSATLAGAVVVGSNLTITAGELDVTASNYALSVAGNWSNSGTFTARAGTVTFNGTTGTQAVSGSTTFYNLTLNNSGATTDFGASAVTIANTLTATAGTMAAGTSTITFSGNTGSIVGAGAKRFYNLVITDGASITHSVGSLTIQANFTNDGTFSQTATLTTTFDSTGTHNLAGNGATTFGLVVIQGSPTVVNAGSHNFSVAGATWSITSGGLFNPDTGTVTFNSTTANQSIGGSATSQSFNNLVVNKTGRTLSVAGSTTTLNINGALTLTAGTLAAGTATAINIAGNWANNSSGTAFTAGSGTVTCNGTSTQTIGGSQSTAFNNLVADNSVGVLVNGTVTVAGSCTVNSSALLGGTGTINGAVIVNGAVGPGASVGTLTTGNETWNAGASYAWEINDAAGSAGSSPGWDKLAAGATIDVQATSGNKFTLALTSLDDAVAGPADNFDPNSDYTWQFASAGSVANFSADKFTINDTDFQNDLQGGVFSVEQSGADLNLKFTRNQSPTANAANHYFAKGVSFKNLQIPIGTFLSANTGDPDSDPRALVLVTSTNATVSTNATTIAISSINGLAESIEYVVKDVRNYRVGDTIRMATNYINIVRTNAIGGLSITNNGGSMTLSFHGIPGWQYVIQRSPDLSAWSDVVTNAAAANGLIQYTETPPYSPAFYRTRTE